MCLVLFINYSSIHKLAKQPPTKNTVAKLICIVGVVGSVAHTLVRGLTRDPASPAAQKLAAQGIEVVQADLNDNSDAYLERSHQGARAPQADHARTADRSGAR